jgi:hypothetical protein
MKKLFQIGLLSLLFVGVLAVQSLQAQATFFSFYFYGNDLKHEALLSFEGEDIDIWIKYYDSGKKKSLIVHQDGTAVSDEKGIVILCSNPTYEGTNKVADYSPDNFFILRNKSGGYTLYNLDDQGSYSAVYGLKELTTWKDFQIALAKFSK